MRLSHAANSIPPLPVTSYPVSGRPSRCRISGRPHIPAFRPENRHSWETVKECWYPVPFAKSARVIRVPPADESGGTDMKMREPPALCEKRGGCKEGGGVRLPYIFTAGRYRDNRIRIRCCRTPARKDVERQVKMPPGGFLPQPWNVRFPAVRTESARLFVLSGFSSRLSVTGKEIFLSTARTRAA